jgi:hypothetical protein
MFFQIVFYWFFSESWYNTAEIELVHVAEETCNSVVVKALCYKLEGPGFETQLKRIIFLNLPNSSGRTRHYGLLNLWRKV